MGTTTAFDVDTVDRAVDAAIRAGAIGSLRVLGYGELTLVLGWPPDKPERAIKRLPPFRSAHQRDRYADLLKRYVAALEARGIDVVPTDLRAAGDHAYLVQPLIERDALLDRVLDRATPETACTLIRALVDHVATATDAEVGLDAQVSNWAVTENNTLRCLDVSTPLMRDVHGRDELDLDLFLSIYPAALRPPLKRIAHSIIAQYHDPRTVLVDVGSNLVKERLDRHLATLVDSANERLSEPISAAETHRYFRRDKALWLAMQRLRRADRAWQRHVRHRPYPFLLPPPYGYGPPELPDKETS